MMLLREIFHTHPKEDHLKFSKGKLVIKAKFKINITSITGISRGRKLKPNEISVGRVLVFLRPTLETRKFY